MHLHEEAAESHGGVTMAAPVLVAADDIDSDSDLDAWDRC